MEHNKEDVESSRVEEVEASCSRQRCMEDMEEIITSPTKNSTFVSGIEVVKDEQGHLGPVTDIPDLVQRTKEKVATPVIPQAGGNIVPIKAD